MSAHGGLNEASYGQSLHIKSKLAVNALGPFKGPACMQFCMHSRRHSTGLSICMRSSVPAFRDGRPRAGGSVGVPNAVGLGQGPQGNRNECMIGDDGRGVGFHDQRQAHKVKSACVPACDCVSGAQCTRCPPPGAPLLCAQHIWPPQKEGGSPFESKSPHLGPWQSAVRVCGRALCGTQPLLRSIVLAT